MIKGGEVRIPVSDLDRAIGFYTEVLGLTLRLRVGDEWATIDAGDGLQLGLEAIRNDTGGSPSWPPFLDQPVVGLLVEGRLGDVVANLRDAGVRFSRPEMSDGLVSWAFLADPDGNHLSLVEKPGRASTGSGGGDAPGERQALLDHLQVRWTRLDPQQAVVEIDLRDDLRGPSGVLQGGVVATMADVAAATCAALATGKYLVATEHLSLQYVAPGRIGPVQAIASPLRVTKAAVVVDVRVNDRGQHDQLVAAALCRVSVFGKGQPG